jgi:hypothetical protein
MICTGRGSIQLHAKSNRLSVRAGAQYQMKISSEEPECNLSWCRRDSAE